MNIDIKTLLPGISKSCIEANPELAVKQVREHLGVPFTVSGDKNALQPIVATKRRGSMTKPEREMAMILEAQRKNCEIESWKFEGVTFKLSDGCRYTPDFFVVVLSLPLRLRIIETKGPFIREDAMIKFKVAKEQNPWAEWQLHQRTKDGSWKQLI